MLNRWMSVIMILFTILCGSVVAESPFNVDCFFGWGGCYRPMEWMPVEVGISSTLAEPFAGGLHVSAQQDGLNTLNITHSFVLTPDVPLHIPLVTKLAFAAEKCSVRIVNDKGRTQWYHDFELWDYSSSNQALTAVGENDLLIGLVGQRGFGLLQLSEQTVCVSRRGQGEVFLKDKLPRIVPWDWTGYAGLDLLILYNPDWHVFNANQLHAIAQWVSNGGALLLVLGSHPLAEQNPLAELLPVELGQAAEVTLSEDQLSHWHLDAAGPETVVAWPLLAKAAARTYTSDAAATDRAFFATGFVGFGRVGVLGFDPATLTAKQKHHAGRFWAGRIAALFGHEDMEMPEFEEQEDSMPGMMGMPGMPIATEQDDPCVSDDLDPNSTDETSQKGHYRTAKTFYKSLGHERHIIFYDPDEQESDDEDIYYDDNYLYVISQAQAGNNVVMEHLYGIAELRPLSIWWVIGLLGALAILIGPVDYFVLKGMGRMPSTWLTCAFWIVVFTIGAYYGVQALRSGDVQMRAVSVWDGIEESQGGWATSYCGIFAPKSGDYALEGLTEQQWWSGVVPAQQNLYAHDRQGGSRDIFCVQHDGSNLPYALPINIWTMQCMLNETAVSQVPIDAEVNRRDDRVAITITNRAEHRIKSGYVLFDGNRAFSFDAIEPGADATFSGVCQRHSPWSSTVAHIRDDYWYYNDNQHEFKSEAVFCAQGALPRTETILAFLEQGAAVVCVEYEQAPAPVAVKDRSCDYHHIQLVRLVVFPHELQGTEHD